MAENISYTESTKKYLDLNGLSYYDSKLKTWVGTQLTGYYTKTEADAKFVTIANFGTHVEAFENYKTSNDAAVKYSKDLWTAFLAGYDGTTGTAAPTLQEIKTFIGSTAATKTDLNNAISGLADVYLTQSNFNTAKDEITNSISTVDGKVDDVADDLAGYKTTNDAAVKKVADDLAGYITSNDAALAVIDGKAVKNAQDIETLRNSLSGAVHFIGVFDKLEDVTGQTNGDIVIVGDKEYVYVDVEGKTPNWAELGDTTSEQGQITELTNSLNNYKTENNAKVAAVEKKIDDYVTSNNGVVEGISGRVTTNEGAISTLQTNVEALQNAQDNYVKAADFISMSEIDALFA